MNIARDTTTFSLRSFTRIFSSRLRYVLNLLGINIRSSITPGVSFFGYNLYLDDIKDESRGRSAYALEHALKLSPKSVLDVGSGGGHHAIEFQKNGSSVVCVDFGTSVYAKESPTNNLTVVNADFNDFETSERFDLVWASHVLEHQRNTGLFIEKLLDFCSDEGVICITLPDPHRNLWGGHLSIWSPGLLAYNVVLCGVDLSDAQFVRGRDEFSLFFRPKMVSLPENLTFDSGDLDKLSKFLPQNLSENTDPWAIAFF